MVPFIFIFLKKNVLQSYIISKALYYAPLLCSNKIPTRSIQSLINDDLAHFIIFIKKSINQGMYYLVKITLERNSTISIPSFFLIAGFCISM